MTDYINDMVNIHKKTDIYEWLINSDFFKTIDELNEDDLLEDPISIHSYQYRPLEPPKNIHDFIGIIKTYMFWGVDKEIVNDIFKYTYESGIEYDIYLYREIINDKSKYLIQYDTDLFNVPQFFMEYLFKNSEDSFFMEEFNEFLNNYSKEENPIISDLCDLFYYVKRFNGNESLDYFIQRYSFLIDNQFMNYIVINDFNDDDIDIDNIPVLTNPFYLFRLIQNNFNEDFFKKLRKGRCCGSLKDVINSYSNNTFSNKSIKLIDHLFNSFIDKNIPTNFLKDSYERDISGNYFFGSFGNNTNRNNFFSISSLW